MNKYAQSSIQDIRRAAATFQTDTAAALRKYRQKLQKARAAAKQYKDEQGYIDREKGAAAREARFSITSARNAFQVSVKYAIQGLRDEMGDHIGKTEPAPGYYDRLRVYKDFDLQPDETEARRLVELTKGSYLGCRALNSVLARTKSPFRVQIPSTADYEADLSTLEKLQRPSVLPNVPEDLHRELSEVFKGEPRYTIQNDNGDPIDTGYKFDSVSTIIETSSFSGIIDSLDRMESRWTGSVLPSLARNLAHKGDPEGKAAEEALRDYAADLTDSQTTAATLATDTEAQTMEYARNLAKRNSANTAEVIAHYTVGG